MVAVSLYSSSSQSSPQPSSSSAFSPPPAATLVGVELTLTPVEVVESEGDRPTSAVSWGFLASTRAFSNCSARSFAASSLDCIPATCACKSVFVTPPRRDSHSSLARLKLELRDSICACNSVTCIAAFSFSPLDCSSCALESSSSCCAVTNCDSASVFAFFSRSTSRSNDAICALYFRDDKSFWSSWVSSKLAFKAASSESFSNTSILSFSISFADSDASSFARSVPMVVFCMSTVSRSWSRSEIARFNCSWSLITSSFVKVICSSLSPSSNSLSSSPSSSSSSHPSSSSSSGSPLAFASSSSSTAVFMTKGGLPDAPKKLIPGVEAAFSSY
mmetsp:Transcript_31963/g.73457  ORF Transcript_31963/g.73457 Transcript_31963/m.73457 type:complete len:332 (+) Transcript_31963:538-1533(+)